MSVHVLFTCFSSLALCQDFHSAKYGNAATLFIKIAQRVVDGQIINARDPNHTLYFFDESDIVDPIARATRKTP